MKNITTELIKKGLLFYFLFRFFSMTLSLFFSTYDTALSNIRVFNFSFDYIQPMLTIFSMVMNLYFITIATIRYFHLLLTFINTNTEENDSDHKDEETQKAQLRKFNQRVMSIVFCLILSNALSAAIQTLGMFSRY